MEDSSGKKEQQKRLTQPQLKKPDFIVEELHKEVYHIHQQLPRLSRITPQGRTLWLSPPKAEGKDKHEEARRQARMLVYKGTKDCAYKHWMPKRKLAIVKGNMEMKARQEKQQS